VQTENMAKKMLIDATHAEETRVVVVDGNKVEEFDFESENKRQLAGNIYLAKVTRVEPSLQAAFVDYGGNRHGFLAFSEIHPDYYQIPVADREALMAEERAYAEAQRAKEDDEEKPKPRRRRRSTKAAQTTNMDAVETKEVETTEIKGMETIDLDAPEAAPDETPDVVSDAAADTAQTDVVDEAPVEATVADAPGAVSEAESADSSSDDDAVEPDDAYADDQDEDTTAKRDAAALDESIESVADEDDSEDIRPVRKPRPKRYRIQEVIKVRQILLIQVVKEERGNKGAALTTYLSLAGRYCVLMPNTARGGGISRKITNVVDRKKLKEIANEIDVPQGAGLIVRTAGAKRTKSEIKRDYEYLQRLWEQIRALTLKSVAPAKIYEEGNLIKRSIRDLYNREIDEVLVEGERGYRVAKDFMKMIMPSHAKNVQHYQDTLPLFARFQVESYLGGMFNPTVQLRSGGYIVIGVTEALVAIDVNSGKATKEGSIEETALKTNMEAAEEVARQLRLRDLAGLIVIDFIDMDERKNNASVEKRMKDKLKTDRARIQVGRISGFGLMEMSRQRLRPGMIEATTQPCPHCHGTGLLRSDDNLSLAILRQLEEEGVRGKSKEVLVRAPVAIANYLMNQKREHIAMIESRYGLSVRVEGDPMLVSPDFAIEKFKTATRAVAPVEIPVVSVDSMIMSAVDADAEAVVEEEEDDQAVAETVEQSDDDFPKKKRRRRRRRRKGSGSGENDGEASSDVNGEETDAPGEATEADSSEATSTDTVDAGDAETEEKPKRTRTRRSRSRRKKPDEGEVTDAQESAAEPKKDVTSTEPVDTEESTPEVEPVADASQPEPVTEVPEVMPVKDAVVEAAIIEPAAETQVEAAVEASSGAVETVEPIVEVVAETVAEPVVEKPKPNEPPKPKRIGWWSR